MKKFIEIGLLLFAAFLAACSEQAEEPLVAPSKALQRLAGFAGEYVIIDVRRASDVAAPAEMSFESPIGQTINFTRDGIDMSGAQCDAWSIEKLAESVIPYDRDPNLIDIVLPPTDSPISAGDRQIHQGYVARCEGEEVLRMHKVDDRILVIPAKNGTMNLILERPLTSLQVKAYQAQLKSMKFYSGSLSGILDSDTLRASRYWYEDRARLDDNQAVPARPAITENLLDALNVLASP
ncbi:MAG: hypothetical protein AAF562_08125 [Pseudomonadota bacterium]